VKAIWDTEIVHRQPDIGGDAIPISGSGVLTNDRPEEK